MQKALRIIEILFGVLVGLPVFVMTVYNLYRQEVNPAAPPLINILPNWHWAIWLSILLFICVAMLILEHFRRNAEGSSVKSHADSRGQSLAAGRDMNINAPVLADHSITLTSMIKEDRTSIANIFVMSHSSSDGGRKDSEQLDLNVMRAPTNIFGFTDDNNIRKEIRALALLVTSQERRKIVELKAKLNFRHTYHEPGFTVFSHDYDLNSFLFWDDEKSYKKEIALRPGVQKILVLCEFHKYKTSNGEEVSMAIMASDPYPESIDFSKESIFQVRIVFQGKLEGEYEYRTLHYEDSFYTKPEDQRILFLDKAEKLYSDIPQELL